MAEDTQPAPPPAGGFPAPERVGGFRLVREVGRGGMGVVYEADDPNLDRRVALKTLLPELNDAGFRQRFLREARAAAGVRNDHVVTIHQVGQDGDTPFLVMEFLAGESLDDALARRPWLPAGEAVRVAREVAEGLAAAHAAGLVHRDVKPGNVWLEGPPGAGGGRVKLLDFGLARPVAGGPLSTAGAVGTPGYMAPEQVYGGPVDARTDLYALGCLLYRMLWGLLPYEKPDTAGLLDAVVTRDAPHLDAVAARYPAPLGDLLRQLLARNPDARPASAAAVAARLRAAEAALAGGGPPARPAPSAAPSRVAGPAEAPPSKAGLWVGLGVIALAAAAGGVSLSGRLADRLAVAPPPAREPVRVGVLHSRTGTFADSERGMIVALDLAADEINAAGGVLGRPVELVYADGHSDEFEFARQAERLIADERVAVIFGCWSSSARKRVVDVCARHDHLLVYSSAYEGLEDDPHVVHVGGAPNQHLDPAARFAYADLNKRRFFLVGSDYVYSRVANRILRDRLKTLGADVVGEEYVPLGRVDFRAVVDKVRASAADVIFNTVDGTSSTALFHFLADAGIGPATVPTFWLAVGEEEMASLPLAEIVGDYASAPYFRSLPGPANEAFLRKLRDRNLGRFGVSDATEASYCAVHLWKQAAEKAGTTAPAAVRDGFRGQAFDGPEGRIKIDEGNLHAWRTARVARMGADHRFEIRTDSHAPVPPVPFPPAVPRREWEAYLRSLYRGWGDRWEAARGPGAGGGP